MVLRRRLVLTQEGLDFTDDFTTAHYAWSQVKGIITRKVLGIWQVEGLDARSGLPDPKQRFIDLTQFDRDWRQGDLGRALRVRAPHLFQWQR